MKRSNTSSVEATIVWLLVMSLIGLVLVTLFLAKVLFKLAAMLLAAVVISPLRVVAEHGRLGTGTYGFLKGVFTLFLVLTAICISVASVAPATLPVDAGVECTGFFLVLLVTRIADASLHRVPRRAGDLASYMKVAEVERRHRQ